MGAAEPEVQPLTHPELFLDREGWEELPRKLEDPFFRGLHEANLAALEQFADEEEPSRGRRALKSRLERATVGWYLTREERWLQTALDALETCCREEQQWRVTDESVQMIRAANLATGELLYNVAFGYDALHPYLPDDLKRVCVEAIVEKGLAAYLEGLKLQDWWVRCDFNWNSALHGNAALAALAVHNEAPELAERVLREAKRGLQYMIDAFYPDGGWIEGVMYFCTALGHLTDFVSAYHRLSGDDMELLANRDVQDTITWKMYMWGGDGRAYNFSDMSEAPGGGLPQVYWWARMLDRPDWTWDNDVRMSRSPGRGGLFGDVESFWYREMFPELRPPELKRLRHFKGIDWLTWRGERTWLAFRSGFNGGNHDNDDLGNFILGIDRERFLCDPGYGPKNASQHNCITVRGFEQTDCATARITRMEELDAGFYVCCDIQQAFPHATVHYDRHLLLLGDEHLLLGDDVQGRDRIRTTVRSYLQTRLPRRQTDEGWRIEGEHNRLRIIHLTDSGFFESDEWCGRRRRDPHINRFSWKNAYDSVHTVQWTLMTFGDPQLICELNERGLRLEVDGRTVVFTVRNGRFHFEGVT